MTTTINNDLRIYQVVTAAGKQFFCNIEQLNFVVNAECKTGQFKVNHFWNNKAQRLSKKDLRAMLEGSQLTQEFKY